MLPLPKAPPGQQGVHVTHVLLRLQLPELLQCAVVVVAVVLGAGQGTVRVMAVEGRPAKGSHCILPCLTR